LVAAGPPWWALGRCGRHGWAWRSAAASWAVRRGVPGRAHLKAAHGNDLLPLPDLESEVAGSPAKDGIGAIVERMERGDNTTAPDPHKGGAEISRELTG
jgi:hypothetical protein